MGLKDWELLGSRVVLETAIFAVHEDRVLAPRLGQERRVTRLQTPDWVNMVALTADRQVVLVRQWRHGARGFTLEIPGGMVDKGEATVVAARRELREETGYAGAEPLLLGRVQPNPAFHDNICTTFLIEDCRSSGDQDLDPGEDIEVVTRPLAGIPGLIAEGSITNSLVVCAFWWLRDKRPDLF